MNRSMTKTWSALALAACGALVGCGPAGIGAGIASLADDGNDRQVFILIFSNPTGEILEFSVDGRATVGGVISESGILIPPGGATAVEVAEAQDLRVRGCEHLTSSTTRPPILWDFTVSTDTPITTMELDQESLLLRSLRESGDQVDAFDVQRLDADGSLAEFSFTDLACTPFGFDPELVFVHPSGVWVYTVDDLGNQRIELRAFRVDSESRTLEQIAGEFGRTPINPIQFAFSVGLDQVDLVFDPLARFAYFLDHDPVNFRTDVQVFHVEEDGSLRPGAWSQHGLLSAVEFRPDGEFVYLYEDFGGGENSFQAYRIDPETGLFNLETGRDGGTCVNVASPAIAIHPNAQFAYGVTQDAGVVRVGAYEIDDTGAFISIQTVCTAFDLIFDLSIDPAGLFLYATGEQLGGGERVIRFPIDADGFLGDQAQQDLGDLSNLTSGADPRFAPESAFRNIVYLAVGDVLVPHQRDPVTGELTALPGDPTLEAADDTSTDLVEAKLSGRVTIRSE